MRPLYCDMPWTQPLFSFRHSCATPPPPRPPDPATTPPHRPRSPRGRRVSPAARTGIDKVTPHQRPRWLRGDQGGTRDFSLIYSLSRIECSPHPHIRPSPRSVLALCGAPDIYPSFMIMSDRLSEVSSVWLFVQSPRSRDPAHCDLTHPTSSLNVHLRNFA